MSGRDYHHLEVGSNLGQYTVERILGKGGWAKFMRFAILYWKHAMR